ncbi:MAG: hypothetical protein WA705_22500 [Candidatus Ozemobacteraceae bacterium]
MRFFHVSVFLFCFASLMAMPVCAQVAETGNASGSAPSIDTEKTPWLDGVTISPIPSVPAPIFPVELQTGEGTTLPATVTEDVPLMLTVHSELLGGKPPREWQGQPLTSAEWTGGCSVNWFFEDIGRNKSTQASCSASLPMNQMQVTPLDPTAQGAVTVYLSRPLRYEFEPGKFRRIYVTGAVSAQTRVLDVTPPTCGLELKQGAGTLSLWAVEAPPHKNPPKTADVVGRGTLLDRKGLETIETTGHEIDLGPNGMLSSDTMTVYLNKTDEVSFNLIITDNDRVEEKTIRFGFCQYVNGLVKVIGEENPARVKPSSSSFPEKVSLFVEAQDPSGNLGRLIVPVQFR